MRFVWIAIYFIISAALTATNVGGGEQGELAEQVENSKLTLQRSLFQFQTVVPGPTFL